MSYEELCLAYSRGELSFEELIGRLRDCDV